MTISGADTSGPYTKYAVHDSTFLLTFASPTTAAGDASGTPELCGAYTYSVHSDNLGAALTDSWVTIDSSGLSISFATTTNSAFSSTKSTESVYIKATLTDYGSVSSYTQVDVTVCTVTTFTAPTSPTNPILYTIDASDFASSSDSDNPLAIGVWTQTDAEGATCGFTETLTFSPALASYSTWIKQTDRTITNGPDDVNVATATETITVTSTLSDSTSTDSGYTFVAQLRRTDCTGAILTAPTPSSSAVSLADYDEATETFSDDAGQDTTGKCGTRSYAVAGLTNVALSSADSVDYTITFSPEGAASTTQTVTLTVTSVEYPGAIT